MEFQVIPAIDIRGGRCVRLFQGRYDQETVFAEDPVEVALQWKVQGAQRLHVVDLDGALEGRPRNLEIVRRIVAAVSIPVEFGGGLRDLETIQSVLDAGVDRAILGTVAVEHPELVRKACELHGEAIAVSLDAREGMVAVRGWTETSSKPAMELAISMVKLGVRRLVYTDISRDGTLTEPNWESTAQLVAGVDVPVVASGGISRADQLVRFRSLGLEGTIVGKALYTGDIKLSDLHQLGLM